MIEIEFARDEDIANVIALYAEAGYGGGVASRDTVIVARLEGRVVGAVRLCPESGVTVLRGMQVSAALQRQGVGARLLAACAPELDKGLAYCLPYAHLASFYAAASFVTVPRGELPEFLAARLASYLERGQDVIAMRRLGRPG